MNPWSLLFPGICLLCRRRSGRDIGLCRECAMAFERNDHACPRCAEPAPPRAGDDASPATCAACIVAPPPQTLTVAPFLYSRPLAGVVEGLKWGNGLLQARILGHLLAPIIAARYARATLPEALVSMPLTRKRMRERGFNQSEMLAAVLGRALQRPRLRRHLVRIRDTPPQRSLARGARLRNVRGAFATRGAAGFRRLALVDDVATTGATVRAAAKALLAGGAEEVHVWVAAKTPDGPSP